MSFDSGKPFLGDLGLSLTISSSSDMSNFCEVLLAVFCTTYDCFFGGSKKSSVTRLGFGEVTGGCLFLEDGALAVARIVTLTDDFLTVVFGGSTFFATGEGGGVASLDILRGSGEFLMSASCCAFTITVG